MTDPEKSGSRPPPSPPIQTPRSPGGGGSFDAGPEGPARVPPSSRAPGAAKTPHGGTQAADLPETKAQRIQLLGKGGFGEVWRVRYLNSDEAWKYIPRRPGSELDVLRETLNARSIDHPNVVRILGIEEERDHYVIRMDLVRGRDLFRVISDDGVLPPEKACRYAIQISEALDAAHRVGVLHLDLKPTNIILKEDGETVMLTDFGISATLKGGPFELDGTGPGGTPFFHAPEQVDPGRPDSPPIGPQADVWALGITIYYLLSFAYPFPFQERGAACILEEPPRPLPDALPYVHPQLWSILEKMLRRDPGERHGRMLDVRAAFLAYLEDISCPACGRTFPAHAVRGVCPEVSCPQPHQVVALKDARSLARAGDSFFARCEHDKAIERYQKVIEREADGPTPWTDRARRLISIAEADRQELARRVESLRKLRAEGALVQCVKEADSARARFSAAAELRALRSQALDAILEQYRTVADTAAALVKGAKFADAKLLLTQVEGFLDYEPVRRVLKDWEEEERKQNRKAPRVNDLFTFVADKEAAYRAQQDEIAKKLAALDLQEAAAGLQRLEADFADAENRRRIRLYRELQETVDLLRKSDPEQIRAALESKSGLPEEPFEIRRLVGDCDRVLASIDPATTPALAEIAERKAGFERIVQAMIDRRAEAEKRLEDADRERRLRDQVAALESLVTIADHTDLLPPVDAARFRELHRARVHVLERAERRYQEGKQLLWQGNVQAALLAFEDAERESPGLFADIGERLAECRERVEKGVRLRERLDQLYNSIMGTSVALDDFREYFQLTVQLGELPEPASREAQEEKLRRCMARLLTFQGGAAAGKEVEREKLEVLDATVDVLLELPQEVLTRSFADATAELDERLLEFFGRIFAQIERRRPERSEVDARIEQLRGIIEHIRRLQAVARPLEPREYQPHPAARASAALLACAGAALDFPRPEARERLAALRNQHEKLAELSDDPTVREQIERDASSLRRLQNRIRLEQMLKRGAGYARWASIPVVTAAVVWFVLSGHFARLNETNRVRTASKVFERLLGAEAVLPADERSRILAGGDDALAKLLEPILVVGAEGAPDAAEAGSRAGVERAIEDRRRAVLALSGLRSSSTSEDAATWNEVLDARISKLEAEAADRLDAHVVPALEAMAAEAWTIDLAVPPEAGLRRAEEELTFVVEGLDSVARATGAPSMAPAANPGDAASRRDEWRPWLEWLRQARPGADAPPEPPAAEGRDDIRRAGAALRSLVRAARVARAVQEIAAINREVYWSEEAALRFSERIRAELAGLAAAGGGPTPEAPLAKVVLRDPGPRDPIGQRVVAVLARSFAEPPETDR